MDPSFHIQKLPVEEGVQMCIARDPEHSTDRVEADSSVLQNEVEMHVTIIVSYRTDCC